MVLKFIGGVETGDRSDSSGDWGLYSSSCRFTAIVANTLNGLGGKLRTLRLGGTIGCWLLSSYVILGSLESESIVTIFGTGEATEEIVNVSLAIAPDSCEELRTAGVLFLIGIPSSDERSTKKRLILSMKSAKRDSVSAQLMIRDAEISVFF